MFGNRDERTLLLRHKLPEPIFLARMAHASRTQFFEPLERRIALSISAVEISAMSGRYGVDLVGREELVTNLGWELAAISVAHTDWSSDGTSDFFQYESVNGQLTVKGESLPIVAVAEHSVDELLRDINLLGLADAVAGRFSVGGMLPISALNELARLGSLAFARRALLPDLDIGAVTSQGDVSMRSGEARNRFNVSGFVLDGSGVKIGVMSDSYNFLGGENADIASGDLPGPGNPNGYTTPVTVSADSSGSDEGRALAQIIHDVAPGAAMVYRTGLPIGIVDLFVGSVGILANTHNVDLIIDDYSFRLEPMFQDGLAAQAVDDVVYPESGEGIPYFTSAGNTGDMSYEATYQPSSKTSFCGGTAHDFDPGPGEDYLQNITIDEGTEITIRFQWDEAFKSVSGGSGAQSDFNVCLADENGSLNVMTIGGLDVNAGGDPVEFLSYVNPVGSGQTDFNIVISRRPGGGDHLVKYVLRRRGFDIEVNEWNGENQSTVFGHNNAAGVGSLGAAYYHYGSEFPPPDPPIPGYQQPFLEPFSARGGTPILFDTDGNRLATPEQRLKPDFVAPDGVNTTFFGIDTGSDPRRNVPDDADNHPNFFGTSASAPHAASLAALMLQVDPALSPEDIYQVMRDTVSDQGAPGYDVEWGYGILDAVGAIYKVWTPDAPALDAGSESGISPSDGIIKNPAPTFTGTVPMDSYVVLYADGNKVGSQQLAGGQTTYSIVSSSLADGVYNFTIRIGENAATEAAGNLSKQSASVQVTIDTLAPRVTLVTAANAAESYPILAAIDSDSQVRAVQLADGMDRVLVSFDEAVQVPAAAVRMVGVFGGTTEYAVDVSPASGTTTQMTATLSGVSSPVTLEQFWLVLASSETGVIDVAGNALDGAWTNPTGYGDSSGNDEYPSGDGMGYGGDFEFKITALLGDTDNDGDVDIVDLNNVRNNFGGTGLGDTDWDTDVDIVDLNNVRNHFGASVATWPSGSPPGAMMAMSAPGAVPLIGEERLRQTLADLYFDRVSRRNADETLNGLFGWNELGDAQWWIDLLGTGWRRKL